MFPGSGRRDAATIHVFVRMAAPHTALDKFKETIDMDALSLTGSCVANELSCIFSWIPSSEMALGDGKGDTRILQLLGTGLLFRE